MATATGTAGKEPAKKKKKKKKHGCLKAFLITLLVVVLLIGILIVVGLFVGDGLLKSNFGISLFDIFGAVGDLGDNNRDKNVTNPYSANDTAAFYDALNGTLYFNRGDRAVITSEFARGLLGKALGTGEGESNPPTDNPAADGEQTEPTAPTEPSGGIADEFVSLLKAENFDKAALATYTGWKEGADRMGGLRSVTDRQLAGFFDDLVFASGALDDVLPLGNVKFGEVMNLEQIVLRRGSDLTAEKRSEYGVTEESHVYLTMTVSADVNKLLDGLLGDAGLPGIAMWAIDLFLPNTAFAHFTVDLNDEAYGVRFSFNSMASETCGVTAREDLLAKYDPDGDGQVTKMDRLLIIVESFSGMDLRQTLNDGFSSVLPYLCASENGGFSIGNLIAGDVGADGSFKLDLYGILADALNEQSGGNATGNDLTVMLQALLCTESERGYANAPARVDDDAHYAAFGEAFLSELERAYTLDFGDKTFADVVELLTDDSASHGQSLQDFLQKDSLPTEGPAYLTDEMLAAVLRRLLETNASELTSGLAGYEVAVRSVGIRSEGARTFADIVMTVKPSAIIPANLKDTVGGLLPNEICLGVEVDITPGSTEVLGEIVRYNELTKASSAAVLNGLTTEDFFACFRAVSPDLDFETLCNQFGTGMRAVIDNLDQVLPNYRFTDTAESVPAAR